ncbi:MAG: hypothetical protein DRR19_30040 [Candidatus Parabeggiatoa sp. nov. 1]|nr:MAG: hypothetical protein DRR19_30040 [Gammaproteobacteria bacterium]
MALCLTNCVKCGDRWVLGNLTQKRHKLIDCQVQTNHLQSLGAVEIPRQQYSALLDQLCKVRGQMGTWQFDTEEA